MGGVVLHWLVAASAFVVVAGVFFALRAARAREREAAMDHALRALLERMREMEERQEERERTTRDMLDSLREGLSQYSRAEREEIARNFALLGETQSKHLLEISRLQKGAIELLATQLGQLSRGTEAKLEQLRDAVEARMKEMQTLVDTHLHDALERRLGAAFANVSEWLDKVHKGLGEMQGLAANVGDLRKVLTNVKTRGTWGEIQLGALLEQVLQKDQYERNVAVRPGAGERVEFAVRLPGAGDGRTVWLPIDSKFPTEDYLRLVEASESGDVDGVAEARRALERRLLEEAKKIRTKYIVVPHTTDFAVLFLPVEGLYAEVLRIDGLCERLMGEYRVVISGPTTVAALLNSLQMGFRTLAVERRSGEVWALLGQVRSEFAKFGAILEKVQQRIEMAGRELEGAGRRSRAIEKRLGDASLFSVDAPPHESPEPLPPVDREDDA